MLLFIFTEKKVARLPVILLHLFTTGTSLTSFLLTQNFFFGMCYFSIIYYIPYYFQTIRGLSMIHTSLYVLTIVISQVLCSVASGQIISRIKHYLPIIWFAYTMCTLGIGLLLIFSTDSSFAACVFILICIGSGVGSTFQPTLVACQAQSYRKDRATVISANNLLRASCGAVGLDISSTILSNTFISQLKSKGKEYFTDVQIQYLSKQIFSSSLLKSLPTEEANFLKELYMNSLKNVFYFLLGSIVYCFLTTLAVKDNGLEPLDSHKLKS